MISPLAYIHPDARLGNGVTVEPFAYIAGDVVIGNDCWMAPEPSSTTEPASAKDAKSTRRHRSPAYRKT